MLHGLTKDMAFRWSARSGYRSLLLTYRPSGAGNRDREGISILLNIHSHDPTLQIAPDRNSAAGYIRG